MFVFSLETLFFIILIAIGIAGKKLYRLESVSERVPAALWIGLTIVVILVTAFVLFVLVSNNRQSPSRVDVSPLAQLTEDQVAQIDNVWMQFEENEYIRNFRVEDFPNNRELSRTYRFDWRSASFISMNIRISVFRDEEVPIRSMQRRMELRDISGRERYIYIANDNNTEATLQHVFTDMPYPVATSNRKIWTDIRIGNVIIQIRETRQWYNIRNDYSSQFIALLVEMLQKEVG